MYIDLNSDLGEGFGAYTMGMDSEVLDLVSSANVACGWHAGDPLIMEKTIALCKEKGVAVGAHPGYPDLMGFGRRKMTVSSQEARCYALYQLGALMAMAAVQGVHLQHMKLHGAFYNTAMVDPTLANAILDSLAALPHPVSCMALSGSYMAKEAERRGISVIQEVFADRGYQEDGTLVPRGQEGAMITDPSEATERVLEMIEYKRVKTNTGKYIDIIADSVCVHGDNPKALAFVESLRSGLENAGITVANFQNRKK